MSLAQTVSMKKIIFALARTSGTMSNFSAAESAAVTIISPLGWKAFSDPMSYPSLAVLEMRSFMFAPPRE